jgi:protein-tyrosine phosphatase
MEKLNKQNKPNKYDKNNQSSNEHLSKTRLLNFFKLKNTNSKVACHGRPNFKGITDMKLVYGVNHVLTLLKPKEKPEEIKECCEKNGIDWSTIHLDGANLAYFKTKQVQESIIKGLLNIYEVLIKGDVVLFIHCAAGLHRTGTLLYSLLRMFDETPDSALDAIKYIREETRNKVGEERIAMAENVIVPKLLGKLKPKIEMEILNLIDDVRNEDNNIEDKLYKVDINK